MSAALPVVLAGSAAGVLLLRPGAERLRRVLHSDPSSGPGSVGRVGSPDGPGPPSTRLLTSLPSTLTARLGPAAAALGGLLLSGPAAGALAAVLAVVARRSWTARERRARRASERSRALEACAVLAAELRAGRAPAEALAVAAEVAGHGCALADALAEATAAGRWGGEVADALERPAGRSAAPDLLRGLASCWRVCTGTGSGLADAVERLERGLRSAQAQRDAVEAELAGPRATAALLALLPLAGTALAAGLGARPVHVLLHTPLGSACLASGVALDLVGVWWTGRLVIGAGGEP